ncbi:transcription elongation factor a [Anaeramoeba flamelloides]|uniref:Transcription elongation factor a n=1 Tax=Anaeramoeba flamelloides TaxID=1746091 RepID=A0ABQ8YP40_9EUKA|nr:transcription elongation factor a [Anaeramoeba flamelloides]
MGSLNVKFETQNPTQEKKFQLLYEQSNILKQETYLLLQSLNKNDSTKANTLPPNNKKKKQFKKEINAKGNQTTFQKQNIERGEEKDKGNVKNQVKIKKKEKVNEKENKEIKNLNQKENENENDSEEKQEVEKEFKKEFKKEKEKEKEKEFKKEKETEKSTFQKHPLIKNIDSNPRSQKTLNFNSESLIDDEKLAQFSESNPLISFLQTNKQFGKTKIDFELETQKKNYMKNFPKMKNENFVDLSGGTTKNDHFFRTATNKDRTKILKIKKEIEIENVYQQKEIFIAEENIHKENENENEQENEQEKETETEIINIKQNYTKWGVNKNILNQLKEMKQEEIKSFYEQININENKKRDVLFDLMNENSLKIREQTTVKVINKFFDKSLYPFFSFLSNIFLHQDYQLIVQIIKNLIRITREKIENYYNHLKRGLRISLDTRNEFSQEFVNLLLFMEFESIFPRNEIEMEILKLINEMKTTKDWANTEIIETVHSFLRSAFVFFLKVLIYNKQITFEYFSSDLKNLNLEYLVDLEESIKENQLDITTEFVQVFPIIYHKKRILKRGLIILRNRSIEQNVIEKRTYF